MSKKIIMRLRTVSLSLLLCAALGGPALAVDELIPVGEAVGIQMEVDGVLVAGTDSVETGQERVSPAGDAGIRVGDVIVAVDGEAVSSALELIGRLEEISGDTIELTVRRNGKNQNFSVIPAREQDGVFRLGLWLRDGVAGIGTVTYLNPETGQFGALGHGVNDVDSGALLPLREGSVCKAQIVDVKKGLCGTPGELAGAFDEADVVGTIDGNTVCGIFGVMSGRFSCGREAIPVAEPGQVKNGPATVLTCVGGRTAREYEVEIIRTGFSAMDGRDFMVRVTDPELLSLTGGIVQGMSGSPVLQNGRLVGAVTHVLVNDPTRGYGILIENMLEAAEPAA